MKKMTWLIILLILAMMLVLVEDANAQDSGKDNLIGKPAKWVDGLFGVYLDRGSRMNHFCPSGWMGDYGDIKYTEGCKDNPYSGKTCIKITYSAEGKQGANWAGIFWQWPPNNWGERKGGYDITGAKKLTFWAKGDKGEEQIIEFKMGGIAGTYCDSDSASIGPVDLTNQWEQFTIDLADLDLSYINGGFCWVTNSMANPDGCVFYLDDIQYEK